MITEGTFPDVFPSSLLLSSGSEMTNLLRPTVSQMDEFSEWTISHRSSPNKDLIRTLDPTTRSHIWSVYVLVKLSESTLQSLCLVFLQSKRILSTEDKTCSNVLLCCIVTSHFPSLHQPFPMLKRQTGWRMYVLVI